MITSYLNSSRREYVIHADVISGRIFSRYRSVRNSFFSRILNSLFIFCSRPQRCENAIITHIFGCIILYSSVVPTNRPDIDTVCKKKFRRNVIVFCLLVCFFRAEGSFLRRYATTGFCFTALYIILCVGLYGACVSVFLVRQKKIV